MARSCNARVRRKIAEGPWGIYVSSLFVERHGKPAHLSTSTIQRYRGWEEIRDLPGAGWMRAHGPSQEVAARCSTVPSVHLAIKSGAGIAPLPAVYAAADSELVRALGPLPDLSYPMFLLAHRDTRKIPRVNAAFEFCLRELKSVR